YLLLSAASAAAPKSRIKPEILKTTRIPTFTIVLTKRLGRRFPEVSRLFPPRRRGFRSSPQNSLRDGQPLHVAGTLVDAADFGIAVQLLDRIILGKSHSAEDLDGARGNPLGHLRREVFSHGGLGDEGKAGIPQARSVIRHQARGFDVHRHLGKVELHALKLGNALAKLSALVGI